MRNILNINCSNSHCNGITNVACDCNELILSFTPLSTQLTNYKVEITGVDGTVHLIETSTLYYVPIPDEYWNGEGTMKVRLLSDEGNSGYTTFKCVSFNDADNVFIRKINDYYQLCTCATNSGGGGDYVLPIASATRLGGIKVGENLSIEPDGTLNATGGSGGSGITAPVNGFFTMAVDEDGNLWAYSAEDGTTPPFEYDDATGELYVVLDVG